MPILPVYADTNRGRRRGCAGGEAVSEARDRTRLALLLAPAGGERRVTDLMVEVGGSQVKSGRALADHDLVDHDEFAELVGEDGCRLSYRVQMLPRPPVGRVKSATVVPSVSAAPGGAFRAEVTVIGMPVWTWPMVVQ